MSQQPKVVTVHRGARDAYQVAHALAEGHLLDTLVTDLYWPGDQPWAQLASGLLPEKIVRALQCRTSDGVPSASVVSCWASGLISMAAGKFKRSHPNWDREATRWCDRTLGERAGRIASDRGAVLLSYSYYGHSAFSHYTGNHPRVLFQLHPHPAAVREILQKERALHPDCASSLDKEWELSLPEEELQFLVEEAAMADHWMVASQFTKRTLVQAGIPADRIGVIPYGIDTAKFSPRQHKTPGNRPLRLLFVGSLGQRKGVKYLLQALEFLPRGAVELTLCGRPVDDMALFRASVVPVRVRPNVSAAELLEEYHAADVFVFPSLAEGFAQVLLEAMASGLPIVSTNRTAAPDLIRHGEEGLLAEPGDALDLAMKIHTFLDDPQQAARMGAAARRRAEMFTWATFRAGVRDFLLSVTESAGSMAATSSRAARVR